MQPPLVDIKIFAKYLLTSEHFYVSCSNFFSFSGANILAVNADQSISFDICEENSECIYYLQNEMRKRNITQKDIENARKAEEIKILADVAKITEMSGDVNILDSDGATLVSFLETLN